MRLYQKPVRQKRAPVRSGSYTETGLSSPQQTLFEKLRWWRMETARAHNLPAYVIFHDATLAAIAKAGPTNLDSLQGIAGIGVKKLEAYGEEVLRVVATVE
jgi:ATP-dependent DNA helicase RecQ